ncbi:MAG: LuxR family transcriptional regulator [Gemmatimonadota bacterium]|nr:LuxR family transcriptional regulator [Gemmatimonadota bacterium]
MCDRAAIRNALAPRERQVLTELLDGRTEATIARRLAISPHTVHAHIRSVYLKLRVHNRVELVRRVLSHHETA